MQDLETRIIEIRDEINSIENKMNICYSNYESVKEKKEKIEIDLEKLNSIKKEYSVKIFNYKLSKINKILTPFNVFLFALLSLRGLLLSPAVITNDILIIISSIVGCFCFTHFESYLLSHITNKFICLEDVFVLKDRNFICYKNNERNICNQISSSNFLLSSLRVDEKMYADEYSSLASEHNCNKILLDEVEGKYFEKAKTIISELKTYNLYTLLNSLSEKDMEDAVNNIEKNMTKVLK